MTLYSNRSLGARVVWQDLADEEDLITMIGDGLADELLRGAIAVHLGGVDQCHAQVEPEAECGDLVLATCRRLA